MPTCSDNQVESHTQQHVAEPLPVRLWLRAALALVFLLYLRAVGFAPVYDDNVISQWSGGWSDIPKYFSHDIFGSDGQAHSVYYRPLSQTWGFLVGWLTGGAPGWLHLVAILTQLAVVVLAFLLGRKLFQDERLALLSALLFGLHPSKIESVAWIGSSLVDGFGGILFFATLLAFLKWRECASAEPAHRRAWGWWAASLFLFAAAMFTKETMVCIPVLLAAYLWISPSERAVQQRPGLVARLYGIATLLFPYGVVGAIYMAIRHRVIRPAGPSVAYVHPTYTYANLWTAPYATWWYLRHLVMPWGLAVEYDRRIVEQPTLTGFVLPAAGLLGLCLAAWVLWRRQRSRSAAFLAAWFVLNLAPPVILATMVQQHDRYLYLSAYPFCALVAWALLRLGTLSSRGRFALVLGAVAFWSGITWHEMGYWDSDTVLWARALQISPSNPKAEVLTAAYYAEAGDVNRALGVVEAGLRYHPDSPSLWLTRANILDEKERFNEARDAYLKVMQISEPGSRNDVQPAATINARADAAYKLSRLDAATGNFVEGERYARTALALHPDDIIFHQALAQNLAGQGRMDEVAAENALELRLSLEQQRRLALHR